MSGYRHAERSKSASVWFKTLDKAGKVLKDYPCAPCFAQITSSGYSSYGGMHKNTRTIHVYRSKGMMPYDLPEIKRWIVDLNEMGFPCRFTDDETIDDDRAQEDYIKETILKKLHGLALTIIRAGHPAAVDPNKYYNFYVDLDHYQDKSHLFSTLSLIRMLSENYYDAVPEHYFESLDKDPDLDKFQVLQNAHKKCNASGGHCVTFQGNGKNITLEKLMGRFQHNKTDLWKGYLAINECWRGER